jgi:nucleoside-diphosphate kinase
MKLVYLNFYDTYTLMYNKTIKRGVDMKSTFVMLKPDALERNLVDLIILEFQQAGFNILRRQLVSVSEQTILKHYEEVISRVSLPNFKERILEAFVNQDVVILEVTKDDDVVSKVREFIGKTNPKEANPNSIRGKFGDDDMNEAIAQGRLVRNLVHASDSDESAKSELALWFKE